MIPCRSHFARTASDAPVSIQSSLSSKHEMTKVHLFWIPVFGVVANSYGRVTNPPPVNGSFLGRWSRTQVTPQGKVVQTLQVFRPNKFSLVSVDANAKKVRLSGTYAACGDTLVVRIAPHRGANQIESIEFKRTDPSTMTATMWTQNTWGPDPLTFSYVGEK